MKKYWLIIFLFLSSGIAYAQTGCPPGVPWCNLPGQTTPFVQSPQTTFQNGQINYAPLEPLSFNSNFGYGPQTTTLQTYLSEIYTLTVTIGGLLAVTLLVVGGVRYMLSEGFTDVDKAKRQMKSAVWGLLIILGSFLILYTINPNLLNFKLAIPQLANQQPSTFSPTTGTGGGSTALPGVTPLNAQQSQAVQNFYDSSGTNAKVLAVSSVNTGDTAAYNAFNTECQNAASQTSLSQYANACATGGGVGAGAGVASTWWTGAGVIGGFIGGTVIGCGAATYAAYSSGKPSVKTVPSSAAGLPDGQTVLSCIYQ